jgi:iron complex outermembrane recepter protein
MSGGKMAGLGGVLPGAALPLLLLSAVAAAQDTAPTDAELPLTLPPVEVVGATPLFGSGVDRDKVPAETYVLTDQDISRSGYPQALRALNEDVPGASAAPCRCE